MPKGLRLPLGVTPAGRGATSDGDENDSKIIMTALSSDESENAFQQGIGLGSSMVFDINDTTLRAHITARLIRIFGRFEVQKRYKLKRETIEWTQDTPNQELILTFKYLNLESDEEQTFKHAFRAGA